MTQLLIGIGLLALAWVEMWIARPHADGTPVGFLQGGDTKPVIYSLVFTTTFTFGVLLMIIGGVSLLTGTGTVPEG